MFFRKRGENEVRLRNRQERTVCLRAFSAPQAAGTHGDLGLLNFVPRSLRIQFRVEKAGQALLLIRLQDVHPWDEKDCPQTYRREQRHGCLLYTSDAADDLTRVD